MGFEEWCKETNPLIRDLLKNAYRAGLLHAAEQDENNAESESVENTIYGHTLLKSARLHRQAAEDL